jgi:hypothetical protein
MRPAIAGTQLRGLQNHEERKAGRMWSLGWRLCQVRSRFRPDRLNTRVKPYVEPGVNLVRIFDVLANLSSMLRQLGRRGRLLR